MRASAIVVRTYLRPISESAHSALACSNPTRLISRSMEAAKPGKTKPSLRPDALQATRRPSTTTTDLARRGEPGKARADHTDIDVDIEGEPAARGRRHHGRRVPGRHVGGSLGERHLFFPG